MEDDRDKRRISLTRRIRASISTSGNSPRPMTTPERPAFFGKLAPQVIENLLWLYTEPGHGAGTVIDVTDERSASHYGTKEGRFRVAVRGDGGYE